MIRPPTSLRTSFSSPIGKPYGMRRPASRRVAEDRMLPLINVVFLLLIFFMVAGRLAASDPFEIDPTFSVSEAEAEIGPMTILVGRDDALALDGEILPEPALLAQVRRVIEAEPGREIRVKSDARAEAARVAALLDRLRQAGVGSVQLMTAKHVGAAAAGDADRPTRAAAPVSEAR